MAVLSKNLSDSTRLNIINQYGLFDGSDNIVYDQITWLASYIADTPIALISIVGEKEQCFIARQGFDTKKTPVEVSFCSHALDDKDELLIVEDARKDSRFKDNPLVKGDPYIVFYAGVPLVSPEGFILGTLCVIDNKPRQLNQDQIKALQSLSGQVIRLFELKKKEKLLEKFNKDLRQKNQELEKFAHRAAHDIKSPLNNISALSYLLKEDHAQDLKEEGAEMLEMIDKSSKELKSLVNGILEYSKSTELPVDDYVEFSLKDILQDIINLEDPKNEYEIVLPNNDELIQSNKNALKRIFHNLISNAIRYCDKEESYIRVGYEIEDDKYKFFVQDNGPGIKKEDKENIFELFSILHDKDNKGNVGTGIGLATVKSLIDKLGGDISIHTREGEGTTFEFSIPA